MATFFESGPAGEIYTALRDNPARELFREDTREHIEKLWTLFEPYAEPGMRKNVKLDKDFHPRMWELYCGATLKMYGKELVPTHEKGPDHLLMQDGQRIWVEDKMMTPGTGDDAVPELQLNTVQSIPEDKILVRLTAGLKEKYEAYEKYCRTIVGKDEAFVIALNCGLFRHAELGPLILNAVFGIGFPFMKYGDKEIRVWSRRNAVHKKNGAAVPTTFFENPKYSGISAIIYCSRSIYDVPSHLGDDMVVVHNPLAKNPLPLGFFPFGKEYFIEMGNLKDQDFRLGNRC